MASGVVTISLDADKADIGNITWVFTDDDTTVFSYTERVQATMANLNAYITRAVAARNAWRTRKTSQTTYMGTAVTRFAAAGETTTVAGIST